MMNQQERLRETEGRKKHRRGETERWKKHREMEWGGQREKERERWMIRAGRVERIRFLKMRSISGLGCRTPSPESNYTSNYRPLRKVSSQLQTYNGSSLTAATAFSPSSTRRQRRSMLGTMLHIISEGRANGVRILLNILEIFVQSGQSSLLQKPLTLIN